MSEVVIYTTEYCPYCVRAKEILDKKQVRYQEVRVDLNPELREEMINRCGRHTVPQIVINNHPIGGCYELQVLDSQGKLDQLLRG